MKALHSFRAMRWIRTVNLILQAILFVTLCGGLNYLALDHGWRYDLTRHHRYSLSPETKSYLESLAAPVRIVVTLTDDPENSVAAQAWRDVHGLLDEYVYASRDNPRGAITTEYLDVYQRRREAEALGIDQPNIILVLCGDRRKVVDLQDLYRIEGGVKRAFLGEKAFTSAILDVANPDKKKIYVTQGHAEMQLSDVDPAAGLSLLDGELRARNFDLVPLDLEATRAVPADASLVLIAGPQGRFDPFEEEQLRQYLSDRAGRVLALLGPARPHGLDNLLYDWGAQADDMLVIDRGAQGQNETGDLILSAADENHPVVHYLAANHIAVRFGPTRPLRVDPGRALDSNLVVTPLLSTSDTAWGERDYRTTRSASFDPGVDLHGPFSVGIASERVRGRDNLILSVKSGRLVAFGGADWIANGRIASGGNLSLFLASINWLIDRDTQLNIPPLPIEQYQLSLNESEVDHLRLSLLFIVPGIVALIGLVVYWTRRH